MLAIGFCNEDIASCLFIKKDKEEFIIIAIHIEDMNLFGHATYIKQTTDILKNFFELKDLG
jgi:hypothetical protein